MENAPPSDSYSSDWYFADIKTIANIILITEELAFNHMHKYLVAPQVNISETISWQLS